MKVEEFLRSQGVEFEKHAHPTTYTAQGLAHAEHVSGYEVAKPVVVRGREKFAMCVLPAPNHLDRPRVARALHEESVRLATEAEMVDLFPDCELGAEPPIGSMFGMSTVMDSHLIDDDYVIMQAGTHRDAVRVRRWRRGMGQGLRGALSSPNLVPGDVDFSPVGNPGSAEYGKQYIDGKTLEIWDLVP